MNRDPRQGSGAGEGSGELPGLGGHGLYGESAPPTVDSMPAGADVPHGGRSVPPEDWITQSLPPGYQPPPLPRNIDKLATRGLRQGRGRRWMVALSAVLALIVAATTVFYVVRNPPRLGGGSSSAPRQANCQPGTACAAANAFLEAYTGGDYEKMYTLTSAASQKRFNSPTILRGNYKDAHDYIVNRTSAILAEASVGEIDATPGQAAQKSATQASVPIHITMKSARVGQITQDLTIPLVNEKGQWRVDWSPGLIFGKIDDPADPTYARRVHMFPQDAPRGTIFDADGNIFAQDTTAYAIEVTPKFIQNESLLLSTLSAKLDLRPDEIKSKYTSGAPDQPHTVRVISQAQYNSVQAALGAVSGITVDQVTRRIYQYGSATAAVTGYMSEITADELKADTSGYYDAGDLVGRDGVEQWGEQLLRPIKGGKLQIVDVNADGSNGQVVTTIGQRDAVPGANIHTTISIKYQRIAMAQLNATHKGGGVVAVDPVSGAVLVLASAPIYNPNDFTLGFTQNELDRFNALDHPYLNRALSSAVPIGSVMKVTTLATALQNGVKPSDIFTCKGSYQVPGENHLRIDDNPAGHGSLTAPRALGPSCDVIFWQVGVLLNNKDPNLLPTMAKAMGYGAPTGMIGIPDGEETGGIVPDPQWLRDNKNADWTATDAANLAIGQGFFEATPAQTAMLTAAVGNGGKRMQPRLVSSVTSASGATLQTYSPKQVGTLPISADNLAVIQVAMVDSTALPDGTSYPIFIDVHMRVAGKTGTAESGQALPHAWFIAYAPASPIGGPPVTPRLAMGIVVQFVGFGDLNASPISAALVKAYFNV